MNMNGKVAVITGAARGLGLAIARRLAEAGAKCVGLDLHPSKAGGIFTLGLACDVTDEAQIAAAMKVIERIDIVAANAGIVPPWSETEAIDLGEWDRVFAVNVRGVAATIKHAVPRMKAHGGSIVLIGSVNSYKGHARQAAYVASKHAVAGIMRAAALDLGRYGIRVNALAPGPIATEALVSRIAQRADAGGPAAADALAAYGAQTALGRIATEAEVAEACLFLASPAASGLTGLLLPIDAGLL